MTEHEQHDNRHEAVAQASRGSRWPRWLGGGRARDERALQTYRRLAMQLRFDLDDSQSGGRCLLLTTPNTTKESVSAVLDLAQLLAQEQRYRVLVIDGCLGSASGLTRKLSCEGQPGLSEALEDPEGQALAVLSTAVDGMKFLPRGTSKLAPMALQQAKRLAELFEGLRGEYDYVLVHGPAMLGDPVALAYPSLMDAVLLLAVENETLLADIDASRETLAECKARRVGIVLIAPYRRWSGR